MRFLTQKTLFLILLLFIHKLIYAQEIFNTITNRLTKISIKFNSENPIKDSPIFLAPENSLILNHTLTTDYKGTYYHRLDLYCIFEKEGKFELGPFVFHDLLGGSVSVNKVSVEVNEQEKILFDNSKPRFMEAPPKFYTIIPHKDFYTFMPSYLIIDIPPSTKELTINWPGWKGVITEKIEEKLKKDGRKEIIFSAIFTKAGKFNLAPLKIRVKNHSNEELIFSTSVLKFDIKDQKKANENNFFTGDFSIKLNPYSATEKNLVNIEVTISGTGFLEQLVPPKIEVTPFAEVFLKEERKEYSSKFPEYAGTNNFTFYFIPSTEGIYTIKIPSIKIFNPINNTFKNLSSLTRTIKVHIPSSPISKEREDYEKNLNIRIRPDYDFYLFLGFFVFITIAVIVLYYRSKSQIQNKKFSSENSNDNNLTLSSVQRSILIALEKITNEELLLSSPKKVRIALDKTSLPLELKDQITQWLHESYKNLYLTKTENKELIQTGLNLLKNIAKATENTESMN